MSEERKRTPVVVAAMLGFVLSNPEALLFGYALAASEGDEDNLEIAEFCKGQAKASGVTEEQFRNALDAMKATNEFLGKIE